MVDGLIWFNCKVTTSRIFEGLWSVKGFILWLQPLGFCDLCNHVMTALTVGVITLEVIELFEND